MISGYLRIVFYLAMRNYLKKKRTMKKTTKRNKNYFYTLGDVKES